MEFQKISWISIALFFVLWTPVVYVQYAKKKCNNGFPANIVIILCILQILIGVWLLKHYSSFSQIISIRGWHLALLIFLTLQGFQFFVIRSKLNTQLKFDEFARLSFKFFILVGFAEEIWFRGILFAVFDNNFIFSVVIGSVFFGLLHWLQGDWKQFVITFLIGFVFATARYNGASIISLSIAHGMMDLLNCEIFIFLKPRFSESKIILLLALITIVLSVIFFLL